MEPLRRLQRLTAHLAPTAQPHCGAAGATTPPPHPREEPFETYAELLGELERRGHQQRVLGHAADGSPLGVIKAGGDKLPPVFISAGAHSTEQAGVVAAVELLDELDTEHAVYILPCRDPIGLTGFEHALELGLSGSGTGPLPALRTVEDAAAVLRERGEVLHDQDGRLVVALGDHAYSVCEGAEGSMISTTDLPHLHDQLRDKRIWWPSNFSNVEGAGPLERAYTQFGPNSASPEEILHINRYHDTPWAPVEVDCARRIMAEVSPRLVIDLHEHDGDDFWMSARHQVHSVRPDAPRKEIASGENRVISVDEEDEAWEEQMSTAVSDAVAASGIPLHSPGRRSNNSSSAEFFFDLGPGVFWLDAGHRGEGLNLADFGADQYGPAFTVETGMFLPFASRVRTAKLVVQTLLDVFAARHR